MTVSSILTEEIHDFDRLNTIRKTIKNYLKDNRIQAMVNVHSAPDIFRGAKELVKAYGFGPILPNTVLLGDTEKEHHFLEYAKLIRLIYLQKRNLLILRNENLQLSFQREFHIEVFWGGLQRNVGLMLALAYLLKTDTEWSHYKLILKTIVNRAEDQEKSLKGLKEYIAVKRLPAEPVVLVKKEDDIFKTISDSVGESSVVFLGVRPPEEDETDEAYSSYYQQLLDCTKHFPPTILTLASENIDFARIFGSAF